MRLEFTVAATKPSCGDIRNIIKISINSPGTVMNLSGDRRAAMQHIGGKAKSIKNTKEV